MVVSNKNSVFHNIWREFDVRSRSLFFVNICVYKKKSVTLQNQGIQVTEWGNINIHVVATASHKITGSSNWERKDAGVVDRGGLENRCTLTGTQGSNPCLSATRLPVLDLQPFFCETTVPSHRFLTAIFVFETAIYPKGYNSASDELFYTRYGVIWAAFIICTQKGIFCGSVGKICERDA